MGLEPGRVRRAVGAQEEARIAAGGRGDQRLAVDLALEHRQAVPVRPQPAAEDRVAVVEQVVGGDRGADPVAGLFHVLRRLAGGDVLEDDAQRREVAAQRLEHPVDEHRLAVEDVDVGIGHLAVHQQRHADPLHRLEGGAGLRDVGDPGVGVGGGAGRVELDRPHHPAFGRPQDLVGRGDVGQVERHQRLEVAAGRQGGQDPLAVGQRLRDRGDRRLQVGHDDRAGELRRARAGDRLQRLAVAQVQVPVVGAGQRERRRRLLVVQSGLRAWFGAMTAPQRGSSRIAR